MEESVEITIMGKKVLIRSDEGADYIREVAEYVNDKMEEVLSESRTISALNVAILASMNIADDYFKTLGKSKALSSRIEKRVDELIGLIDTKLE